MPGKKATRRTILKGIGTTAAVGGLGVVGSVGAATSYREVDVDGGANDGDYRIDYTLSINSSDVSAVSGVESNDNIYNYSNSTTIYGHLQGNGGVDTYKYPHDASVTYLSVDGDKDGTSVDLSIEPRTYGKQTLAFRGLENPGFSKIKYSATSANENAEFTKENNVEGYPEDTTDCGYGLCSLSGRVKADHEDVWTLNGSSLQTVALDTQQQGGRAELDIDVISPSP